MLKIAVPNGGRSNEGLIEPILKRLRANPGFEVFDILFTTEVGDFNKAYKWSDYIFTDSTDCKIDLVLCVGDRVEITAAAAAAFHHGIPIAHVYAGTVGDHNMLDAVNRHVITLWSDIQFCESDRAAEHATALKSAAGLGYNTHVVGCTHMDDLVVAKGPDHLYDLVLFNPLSKNKDLILKELDDVFTHLKSDIPVIWMGPNNDKYAELIVKEIAEDYNGKIKITYIDNIPRPEFLGLIQNCQKFIGNSSSMFYEAPALLDPVQIIHVGTRNAGRETITQYGASNKIVQVLEDAYVTNR